MVCDERDERDESATGERSLLGRQVVGGTPAHAASKPEQEDQEDQEDQEEQGTGLDSPPHRHLPPADLQVLRLDHAPALLAFEGENRAYFAAAIPDRGDAFFAEFDTRLAHLLAGQAAGEVAPVW
ncbi:MAG TPA: hypothetical protein VE338_21150 [Ktedonobacterales bacterium]|jgi:ribosomal-protein-alanine N-acetyltransferase|nr:hypothetical protein [Ktedonobacterales bacterium]